MRIEKLTRWTHEASRGLGGTFVEGNERDVPELVNTGRLELYKAHTRAGVVFFTSFFDPKDAHVHILNIQGQGLMELAPWLLVACYERGVTGISFATHRPAIGRAMRRYGFVRVPTMIEDSPHLHTFTIDLTEAAQRVA